MIHTSETILLQSLEQDIEICIGCSEDDNPGFNESKYSVNQSFQVMRKHVFYHLDCNNSITAD